MTKRVEKVKIASEAKISGPFLFPSVIFPVTDSVFKEFIILYFEHLSVGNFIKKKEINK